MNDQRTLDKGGGSAASLKERIQNDMNNHTTYELLVHSEEKGRTIIETAVYIMCILSVVIAIFQFVGQPIPDPFAGFDSSAQPKPVASHHETAPDTKS